MKLYFPEELESNLFIFRKLQNQTKSFAVMKRKMNQCGFWQVWASTLQLSQGGNTSFANKAQFFCSQLHISLHFQSIVKTHLGNTCTILWEQSSRESVIWVLIVILIVILIRWNSTVSWLPSKDSNVLWSLQTGTWGLESTKKKKKKGQRKEGWSETRVLYLQRRMLIYLQ